MKLSIGVAVAMAAAMSAPAFAGEVEVRAALQKIAPAAKIESLSPNASNGYYEAVLDGQVVYVSEDGQNLFIGELWRVDGKQNLTALRKNTLRRDALAAVGPDQRIVFAADDPKYTVSVFTDFDCGYCQRMHHDIAEYNKRGITVEYLLFPRGGLNSPSFEKAVSVWCAADRKQAFTLAKAGTAPEPKSCPNKVAESFALAARVGVTGTPMVIDATGNMVGYLPPDQMLARLETAR
jgi:thiol:disulfide interchange protein DsbC